MSLAGPYGEAACRYCNTLVDLREDRRLVRHSVGGNRARCRGSLSYAHTQKEKEVESLAFSSDPVERLCPHCGQLVVISTVSQSRAGWRYGFHELPHLQPEQDCIQSGQLVSQVRVEGQDGLPSGEYRTSDGSTLNIEPFDMYGGF